MHQVRADIRVGERALEASDRVAGLDEQPRRGSRQREGRGRIDGRVVDEPVVVLEAASREILSRAGAGRSAVRVVEDHGAENEMVELRGDELDPGITDEAISLPAGRQNAREAVTAVTPPRVR
jgi:hypothetical protein